MTKEKFGIHTKMHLEGYDESVNSLKRTMDALGLKYDESENDFKNFSTLKEALKKQDSDYDLVFKDSNASMMSMFMYKILKMNVISKEIDNLKGSIIIGKTDKEINEYLAERGWFLSNRIDLRYIKEYIGAKKEKEIDDIIINEIFEEFFKQDDYKLIYDVIESWKHPYFLKREHIFKECMWALKNNRDYLVPPTMYSQLEGIVRDIVEKDGYKISKYNGGIIKAIEKVFNSKSSALNNAIIDILSNDVFINWNEIKINNFNANRNKILHGIELNYGEKVNSIRIILMLDAIHDILIE